MSLFRPTWCKLHYREDGITHLARLQDDHQRLLAEVMRKRPEKLASYTLPHDLSLLQLQDAIAELRSILEASK